VPVTPRCGKGWQLILTDVPELTLGETRFEVYPCNRPTVMSRAVIFFMSRSRERKEGARLKRIEPLPLPVELEDAFAEVEKLSHPEPLSQAKPGDCMLNSRPI
jgi:hypothetical protein